MKITDVNGNVYTTCPRCLSNWILAQRRPDWISSDECKIICDTPNCMEAPGLFGRAKTCSCSNVDKSCGNYYCLGYDNAKVLRLIIDKYQITWTWDKSRIDLIDETGCNFLLYLPLLPYNVSLQKLKTYILFS